MTRYWMYAKPFFFFLRLAF